jgi:hypothetical protein
MRVWRIADLSTIATASMGSMQDSIHAWLHPSDRHEVCLFAHALLLMRGQPTLTKSSALTVGHRKTSLIGRMMK